MAIKRISPEIICDTGTFNDTATHLLCTFTVPVNSVLFIEAVVLGKDASNVAVVAKMSSAASMSTGSVSLVGSIVNILSYIDASNLGATVTIVVSGTTVSVQVKGPTVAKSIDWQSELRIYIN